MPKFLESMVSCSIEHRRLVELWEKEAQDPKMTSYLQQGVKAKNHTVHKLRLFRGSGSMRFATWSGPGMQTIHEEHLPGPSPGHIINGNVWSLNLRPQALEQAGLVGVIHTARSWDAQSQLARPSASQHRKHPWITSATWCSSALRPMRCAAGQGSLQGQCVDQNDPDGTTISERHCQSSRRLHSGQAAQQPLHPQGHHLTSHFHSNKEHRIRACAATFGLTY